MSEESNRSVFESEVEDDDDFTFDQADFELLEANELSEAAIDADLSINQAEQPNKEFLQAFDYDRAFMVKGSVVKIYKNDEQAAIGQHQRL